MTQTAATAATAVPLPADGEFLRRAAQHVIAACASSLPDLSAVRIVVARPELMPPLRQALAEAAGCVLLLPRITTLDQLAAASGADFEPDSRRAHRLYAALRQRRWFERGALWQVCDELLSLFDELTERALQLPADTADFAAQLARAYGIRASAPLQFEARLVHELWHAEGGGAPSRLGAQALALAGVARLADGPLFAVWDEAPRPWQQGFFDAYATQRVTTLLLAVPALPPSDARGAQVHRILEAAWPRAAAAGAAPALGERARALAAVLPASPLAQRLVFIAADGIEELAVSAVDQVRRWLAEGRCRIALIAADREAARRVRALLERDAILVADETGWKLSTTRAAALIDAWCEVLARGAYYRDILDVAKSPFVFGDLGVEARRRAALELEACIAQHDLVGGLDALLEAAAGEFAAARSILERIAAAAAAAGRTPASLGEWLARLLRSLALLGAEAPLAADAAGREVLQLLRQRRDELAGESLRLDFDDWREWLDHQMEAALFRDRSIDSPVLMTHAGAAYLRRFDAALVIGADLEHLLPAVRRAVFVTQSVRRELGLATAEEAAARLRAELAYLVLAMPRLTVLWQRQREGEALLLNAEFDVLSLVHELAFGDALRRAALRPHSAALVGLAPQTAAPRPVVPQAMLPTRLSASGYASLVACPYQFFARRVLGLEQPEQVQEALEKRDYGRLLHAILARFQQRFPHLGDHDDASLVASLEAISAEEFAAALRRNFLEHAWLARWRARVPGYVAWQRQREAAHWRFDQAEQWCQRTLVLDDGTTLTLEGRIDRIDRGVGANADQFAILDFKTQKLKALRERVRDPDREVQLAFYALLLGPQVAQAGFLPLDDEDIDLAALDAVQPQAQRQQRRLLQVFADMAAGAALPANGTARVCAWCDMAGLCRRAYHDDDGGAPS